MLTCPYCENELELGWRKYLRSGLKYTVTCDVCDGVSRVQLPLVLRISEIAFAAFGPAALWGITHLWEDTERLPLWLILVAIGIVPWLVLNFFLNVILDGRLGTLCKHGKEAENKQKDEPGHWIID